MLRTEHADFSKYAYSSSECFQRRPLVSGIRFHTICTLLPSRVSEYTTTTDCTYSFLSRVRHTEEKLFAVHRRMQLCTTREIFTRLINCLKTMFWQTETWNNMHSYKNTCFAIINIQSFWISWPAMVFTGWWMLASFFTVPVRPQAVSR